MGRRTPSRRRRARSAATSPPRSRENIVHGSDSPASAERELKLFFGSSARGRARSGVRPDRRTAEHHLEVSHSAGLALAVTDREEVLGVVCRGLADVAAGTPVRPETRFHIGSISKSFAAMIVLQEVAAGRLDLHVSVNEILPWLELPEPFGPITMHDLMTHTAGLLVGTEDAPTGSRRAAPPQDEPGDDQAGGALAVLERRVEGRRRVPRGGDRASRSTSCCARACSDRSGCATRAAMIDDATYRTSRSATSRCSPTGRCSCDTRSCRRTGSSATRPTARSSPTCST